MIALATERRGRTLKVMSRVRVTAPHRSRGAMRGAVREEKYQYKLGSHGGSLLLVETVYIDSHACIFLYSTGYMFPGFVGPFQCQGQVHF